MPKSPEKVEVNALRKEREFWLDQASIATAHTEEAKYYMHRVELCERDLAVYEVPFMLPEQVEINALRKEREFWLSQAAYTVQAERFEYFMAKAEQSEAQLEEYSEELRFLESLTAPSVQPSDALIEMPF